MSSQRTMEVLSYGFSKPEDMLAKLEREGSKLTYPPDRDDVFNFIVTAAVLGEWVKQYYRTTSPIKVFGFDKGERRWIFPDCFADWITDTSCFPNEHYWLKEGVNDALSICDHTCNASKHFIWNDDGAVQSIGHEPEIADLAEYFFASTEPDVYIVYEGSNYGLTPIRGILIQFYKGLIPYIESLKEKPA